MVKALEFGGSGIVQRYREHLVPISRDRVGGPVRAKERFFCHLLNQEFEIGSGLLSKASIARDNKRYKATRNSSTGMGMLGCLGRLSIC